MVTKENTRRDIETAFRYIIAYEENLLRRILVILLCHKDKEVNMNF